MQIADAGSKAIKTCGTPAESLRPVFSPVSLPLSSFAHNWKLSAENISLFNNLYSRVVDAGYGHFWLSNMAAETEVLQSKHMDHKEKSCRLMKQLT